MLSYEDKIAGKAEGMDELALLKEYQEYGASAVERITDDIKQNLIPMKEGMTVRLMLIALSKRR